MSLGEPIFRIGDQVRHVRANSLQEGVVQFVTDKHHNDHPKQTWWYGVRWKDTRRNLSEPNYWAEDVLLPQIDN